MRHRLKIGKWIICLDLITYIEMFESGEIEIHFIGSSNSIRLDKTESEMLINLLQHTDASVIHQDAPVA